LLVAVHAGTNSAIGLAVTRLKAQQQTPNSGAGEYTGRVRKASKQDSKKESKRASKRVRRKQEGKQRSILRQAKRTILRVGGVACRISINVKNNIYDIGF